MLRINLLPPYIYDKQKKIPFIVGSLLLIPITLALMLWWGANAQKKLDEANERSTQAQAKKTEYDDFVAKKAKEEALVAATKQKEDFVANSIKYNESWPRVYTAMRDVTSPKVLLKSLYVSDDRKSINFTGFCAYEEDLVRWWMYLRSQSALFTSVHFKLPDHPWPPKASTAAAGGGGGSMAMAGPGGGAGGSSGPAMGLANGGGGMPTGMGGSAGGGGMSAAGPGGGSFGGGGGATDAVGDTTIEGRKGINFTAFATLKDPLAGGIPTPVWAGGGAAPAEGGAGGGMPMGSGGMPMGSGGMPMGSGGAGMSTK